MVHDMVDIWLIYCWDMVRELPIYKAYLDPPNTTQQNDQCVYIYICIIVYIYIFIHI